jgi:hypothetical protein
MTGSSGRTSTGLPSAKPDQAIDTDRTLDIARVTARFDHLPHRLPAPSLARGLQR